MRRFLWQAFSVLLACATVLNTTNALIAGALAAPVSADDQAVEAADRAFKKAVAKDPVALEMQTDPAFTWIDATGTLQSREEILDAFGAGTAPELLVLTTAVGVQLTTRVYGQLAFVQVHAGRSYSLRIFAKHIDGWRGVHVIELTQPPQGEAPTSATGAAVPSEEGVITDCINPCKFVPFRPGTPAAKAAFADWREMELGSLARNMDLWGRHVLDDVIIVDSGGNGTFPKRSALPTRSSKSKPACAPTKSRRSSGRELSNSETLCSC